MTTASARPSARAAALPAAVWLALACFALALACLAAAAPAARAAEKRVAPKRLLVVTVTKGFRHDSIPVAEEVLGRMAETSKVFTVDYVRTDEEMASKMSPEGLKQYDAVFFANTTGDLPIPDRDAFIKWIADGHAFLGAHAATDTYPGYPAYIDMIGGQFRTHGPQVEVECRVEDHKHPATKDFASGSFKVFDEIYLFQKFDRSRVHGLLTLDAHPNAKTPGDYPVAWTRREGKGRVFYTSLGHRKDIWNAEWYQKHLMGGIRWALGLEKGDDEPQRKKAAGAPSPT
ncbi:MAG TPA: ThuA domain-containing protein [Armatimonadaceae bacterium]|nr:ThuA domain-containing protein [Armatimonadaceae bacterium]